MASYLIPIYASQSQQFGIPLNGNYYYFKIVYRNAPSWEMDNAGWFLDILDNVQNPIIQGLALVPQENLLDQYNYLQLGFALYIQGDRSSSGNPGYNDLGVHFFLYAVY